LWMFFSSLVQTSSHFFFFFLCLEIGFLGSILLLLLLSLSHASQTGFSVCIGACRFTEVVILHSIPSKLGVFH
jgi:hypothetical protein